MFNSKDKLTLGFFTYDINGKNLGNYIKFPFENEEEFVLPSNTCFVQLFESYQRFDYVNASQVLKIYVAEVELPVVEFLKESSLGVELSSLVEKEDLSDVKDSRFCGNLNPSNGKMTIVGSLKNDDFSVRDIETLKTILLKISSNFKEIKDNTDEIRNLYKKPKH